MIYDAKQISDMLAQRARDVCQYLLPQGKKVGSQWQVGSINGEKGSSLNIQLSGTKAGVWADFSTSDRGDMLSLWQLTRRVTFTQALDEACKFIGVQTSSSLPIAKTKQKKEYTKPVKSGLKRANEGIYKYFESRLIPSEIVDFLKIVEDAKGNITFPYIKDGELLGLKYLVPKSWSGEQRNKWWKEAGCEPCLWGWDCIGDDIDDVTITEGEIDALSLYTVGFCALSIPSGAAAIDSWLEIEFDRLQKFKTIRLCLDSDEAGKIATEKIAKRLGIHRVLFVELPEKDANDTLCKRGKQVLVDCVNKAKAVDPDCIKRASDYKHELFQLIDPAFLGKGARLPWEKCGENFIFRPSEITLWTGWNGHGKTQLLNYIAINGMAQGDKWMIFSPEMRPRYLIKRLVTQITSKPLVGDFSCSAEEIVSAINFLDENMLIFDSQKTEPIEKILESFTYARNRYGVSHFVIDSLQKCGLPEGGDGELAAQKRFMDKLCEFKSINDCHVHLVAHPRKGKDELSAPSKQDIKGSGSICDLADNIMIIQRNKQKENSESPNSSADPDVFLEVAKQRNGEWEGVVSLYYHKDSYQYLSGLMDRPRIFIKD